MRAHHLDCMSMCALGGWLMDGRSPGVHAARLTCHCLLLETDAGLVLVDTGFGLQDVRHPKRDSRLFMSMLRPQLEESRTAARQIEARGYSVNDVRHIVLTHLDFDHAGGLDDFPKAAVHLLAAEANSAARRATAIDRARYRPQQWGSSARWRTYLAGEGEPWFGFDAVRELEGLPPEILLVPLIGHTLGHAGVAVDTREGWLLHAGDAYFYNAESNPDAPFCPPGLRGYQRMMEKDRKARLWNQERLRQLRRQHGREVRVFCAHDALEYERLLHAERERARREGLEGQAEGPLPSRRA